MPSSLALVGVRPVLTWWRAEYGAAPCDDVVVRLLAAARTMRGEAVFSVVRTVVNRRAAGHRLHLEVPACLFGCSGATWDTLGHYSEFCKLRSAIEAAAGTPSCVPCRKRGVFGGGLRSGGCGVTARAQAAQLALQQRAWPSTGHAPNRGRLSVPFALLRAPLGRLSSGGLSVRSWPQRAPHAASCSAASAHGRADTNRVRAKRLRGRLPCRSFVRAVPLAARAQQCGRRCHLPTPLTRRLRRNRRRLHQRRNRRRIHKRQRLRRPLRRSRRRSRRHSRSRSRIQQNVR